MIGGGAAGLTVAFGAASAGIDVAMIEAGPIGGECTWRGCVPSKTLLDVARDVHTARRGSRRGVEFSGEVNVDLSEIMGHIHDVSHEVAAEEDESALREAGVAVYTATAKFLDPDTLQLDDGSRIRADQYVIATGGTARVPTWLADVPHVTSDTIWTLTKLPERLVVLGGGPIGCELGQAFSRLGSDVVIITEDEFLLGGADKFQRTEACPHAGAALEQALRKEGVEVMTGAAAHAAQQTPAGIELTLEDGRTVAGSLLLVAVGQTPRTDGLGLDAAGVASTAGRLVLDDQLRTTQPHIFACGDVADAAFTHIAGAQAAGVLVNLVAPVPVPVDSGPPRWAVFTDPEVAQLGLTCSQAHRGSDDAETTSIPIRRSDRAITQGAEDGLLEVVHTRSGRVLGVTAVGPNAGELVNQWVEHLGKNLTAAVFTPTIYPTMGSVNALFGYLWADRMVRNTLVGVIVRGVIRWWMGRFKRRTA